MLRHVIHTFEAWRAEDLQRGAYLSVGFDADLDERIDRVAYVGYSQQDGLYGTWRYEGKPSRSITVNQSGYREVRLTFPRRALDRDTNGYGWYALVGWQRRGNACSPVPYVCEDWYPNGPRASAELVRHEV